VPRIFLSYRRDDASGYAGRLFDSLAALFRNNRDLMDAYFSRVNSSSVTMGTGSCIESVPEDGNGEQNLTTAGGRALCEWSDATKSGDLVVRLDATTTLLDLYNAGNVNADGPKSVLTRLVNAYKTDVVPPPH
jgi:hypothetical protein